MSAEPPSSDRPTDPTGPGDPSDRSSTGPSGPPSGPLSEPSRPPTPPPPPAGRPAGPPSGPTSDDAHGTPAAPDGTRGGTGGGPGGGAADRPPGSGGGGRDGGSGTGGPGAGGGTPWWRSAPRVALLALGVVAAVVLGVVLTRPDGNGGGGGGGGGSGEVFLQAANSTGRDPFTASTARDSSPPPSTPSLPDRSESASGYVTQGVSGAEPGLYGGTRKVGSCDVAKQVEYLGRDSAKNTAFAAVLDVEPSGVPAYLRALTPVQLRLDTRVTNHGYRDGRATAYQAVLEAGTAVLVDDRGVPKVRCACGNPLAEPVALRGDPKQIGDPWPGYRESNVVFVKPAPHPVESFVMYDADSGGWFTRERGDTGPGDRPTQPPKNPTPSPDGSPSDSSGSPEPDGSSPSEGTSESPDGTSTGESPPSEPSEPTEGSGSPVPESPPPGSASAPGSPQAPPQEPASPGGTSAAPGPAVTHHRG
ncbi:DUF6777 domain-containing protein [Streptomyces sp. NPDC127068]|uniref:DUF6777 domain-containing protein n=1 Tax=Streptomyces sp. NPDC127068 TaxID=3347127 RepID=UPI0036559E80